jgi:hypothetical protein
MGGMFKYRGTHGLSLADILSFLKERDMVMDWIDYITSALNDGANISTVRASLQEAVGDVYGQHHRDEVLKRFDYIVEQLNG